MEIIHIQNLIVLNITNQNQMKTISKLFIILLSTCIFIVNAQEKLPLKQSKEYYKNKKVSDLLNDLQSNIKAASFYGGWSEEANRISLRFEDNNSKVIIFVKEHDPKTNKLFINTDPDNSRKIKRISKSNKSNINMLSQYSDLTIAYIL